jgi:4-hydroxybenzoyl-CoA thioesterase
MDGTKPLGRAMRFVPPQGAFTRAVAIRFAHCDPAGIVYFPRFFDMIHGVYEDWFGAVVGIPFAELLPVRRLGTPAVKAECDFHVPSRMGEELFMTLLVERLGRSSMTYRVVGHVEGVVRLTARVTTATVALDTGRAIAMPAEIRDKMEAYRALTEAPA